MGIDIVPLAYKHKLDISSPDAFAKDISKRFSANIILKKRDEDYNTIEMFRLHHEHYCPRKSFNISKSNKLIVTRQN